MILEAKDLNVGMSVGIKIYDDRYDRTHYLVRKLTIEHEGKYFDESYDLIVDKDTGKMTHCMPWIGSDDKILDEENVYDLDNYEVKTANRLYYLSCELEYIGKEMQKIRINSLLHQNKDLQEQNMEDLEQLLSQMRAFI